MNKLPLANGQTLVMGIYGGMGPLSHIEFEKLLIEECSKRGLCNDQSYPIWVLLNGSSTPDRTLGLKGKTNPIGHLYKFAKRIELAGANFIVVICNTAHAYLDKVQKKISIPWVSMPISTCDYIINNYPNVRKVGILSTTGTIKAKVYEIPLTERGIECVVPEANSIVQKKIMEAIYNQNYGIKFTGTTIHPQSISNIRYAIKWCRVKGAEIIVLACTEIALASSLKEKIPLINPLKVLAERSISLCFGEIALNENK